MRKSRPKETKSQNHLKKEQNNGQLVLVAVDATSGPAHIKFFVKAISSTHDEVALTKGNSEKTNTTSQCSSYKEEDLLDQQPRVSSKFRR
jgi:hypothetical protein